MIQSSLGQIGRLVGLVDTLAEHVTEFSAAMEQVRSCSADIAQIAETTDVLSLNAAIEAERAGNAGRTFAVVAGEVKALAHKTKKATSEISRTVYALGSRAEKVIGEIEAGNQANQMAKSSIEKIEGTITGVVDLVREVDEQNEQIARANSTISGHVSRVQDVLDSFDGAARDNEARLGQAQGRMGDLEEMASVMFDRVVHAGLAPQDGLMVDKAIAAAEDAKAAVLAALESGELDERKLFDTDYVPVPGTSPQLFRTRLSDWADRNWRPILDRVKGSDPRIFMTVCDDCNGHIVTHMSEYSRPPTGNPDHDLKYSRNGRILFNAVDKRLKESRDRYSMAVYRHERENGEYMIVRMVSVPMEFRGRRWGCYELSYAS